MKRLFLAALFLVSSAQADLIFDNGSGDKNDTLVIQFCLVDSAGARYATWDTAYVVQAYGGVDFNVDTLLTASNYDLNAVYPRNLMFEYRLGAFDGTTTHVGAYTWWVLLVDSNNGSDTHQMHRGCYYVNDDPLEDFLSAADTAQGNALGKMSRDVFGDSIPSIADNILLNPSNRLRTDSAGYVSVASAADNAFDSASYATDFYRSIKRHIWLDSLDHYNYDPGHRQANTILEDIASYTDGDGLWGIDEDIGDPSGSAESTRVAWATDDSLGSGTVPESLIARVDSIRWAVGMPVSVAGEKYPDNLHRKVGAYSGAAGDNNNVRDDIAALSLTGGGSEACTLFVKDNGVIPIYGARIVIRTLDQSAVRVPGLYTDVNGRGVVELDAAAYFVSLSANNYIPQLDTIYVSGDSSWSLSMAPFDPGSPQAPDLCRVYGWIYDISGNLLEDVTVTAEIPSEFYPVKYGNVIITPFEKSVVTDTAGYWRIDLFPNSVLSDTSSRYQFTIEYPSGVVLKSRVEVPDSLSWQFR